jgi:hypothetical protein
MLNKQNLEKDIMEYNAKIGEARKFEEANFSRIQGSLARKQASIAQLGYYNTNWNKFLSLVSTLVDFGW